MTIENISTIKCDECEKRQECSQGDYENSEKLPKGWFSLFNINLEYAKTGKVERGSIPFKNSLDINEDSDPDFCCKKCLMTWLERNINRITRV